MAPPTTLGGMENVLRPLIVIGGSVVLTLIVGWLVDLLLRRADATPPRDPTVGSAPPRPRPPQVVLCTALLRGSYDQAKLTKDHPRRCRPDPQPGPHRLHRLAGRADRGGDRRVVVRPVRGHTGTPARVRRVRTQVTLIQRVVTATVGVVAVAAMLLTFPAMQAAGASLLASAGILGIVAGVAAQSTLGNLFAGLQIAFGDMVRLGDTVVVDGEWGTVDEITLTFLTVRTWDERRITMPVSYFTAKPFENWSRGGAQMTGTVFFQLDHRRRSPRCERCSTRSWRLRVLGRPGPRPSGHGHHAQHDRGPRPGHR